MEGTFRTEGETVGTAVVSRQPVLELTADESAVLDKFVETLRWWVHVSSQFPQSQINKPRNLIAERYPSLLEYSGESGSMTLVDSSRVQQSADPFDVPSDYEVRSLEDFVGEAGKMMDKGQ
jgi:hypothetical protein